MRSDINRQKVLIVDDVTKNIQLVANFLKQAGYEINYAISGKTAIRHIKKEKFDLILLDIMMPEMDGFEVCHKLKSDDETKDIPVIFLTAKADIDSITKAFKVGGIDYITKPFNKAELLARVKTHLELQQQKRNLKELNATKDKFFSIIAHDLKNPFSSLLGISKMLTQDLRNMTMKELQESSDVMYSSAQNLYKLLENLLDWSRLQSGLFEIKPQSFNVRELVTHGIVLFSTSAEQKRISIKNNINKLHEVYADPEMIDTVIRNLISNSIKFTKPGGLITIASAKKNGSIEIIVKDNGVGISTNIKKNLFKIDSKVSMPGTENEPGSGLGLMLCKDLVKINKGKISVKSKHGKGSEFIITLPKFKK
ncbi:MAG: hybrid sensor histidine kinase/response regulator [Cyclobacteriaceae bacterium]|nr:hybrid sensor histidine kinase/response regulator [Cyclobacteriaceae bacterium]